MSRLPVGISGYGVAVPRLRIKKDEYAKAWGSFQASGVAEKAVMGFDEDILTFATKVSKRALASVALEPGKVTRLALASTSAPYVEKVLSGTIVTGVGIPRGAFVSDHTTSSRAGTEAFMAGIEHVIANPSGYALVAVADAPKASMWSPIEHGLGAGAAGFVLSHDDLIAEFEGHAAYACEHFGERFRPRDEELIRDLNVKKFAQSSFMGATVKAASSLLKNIGTKPEDYAHVVIQQPDARLPRTIAKKLGFTDAHLASSSIAGELGDLGAASAPVGLAAALDAGKLGERILVISYGSGAASDAMSFKIVGDRKAVPGIRSELDRKHYIDYIQYLKLKGAIK
ncbi:MAG: hydroxymethylglutaryl-CoA synthase [Candidatus Thermoplasmatota archaeon]|nr:hydroxymethylglutaryl-CoA synthase [Candidatus Thermoplasmatota archaeon]